jgi:hypothetical protein
VESVAADVAQKCEDLERTLAYSWARPFGTWHNSSFYKTLQNNISELGSYNICIASIRSHSSSRADQSSSKTSFQREARDLIKSKLDGFDAEERMRTRVKRWRLLDPPAHVARRIVAALGVVGKSCRPCVSAACLRVLFNGWPTTARMRFMAGAQTAGRCILGCNEAEDRIEHYLVCPVAWRILAARMPYGLGLADSNQNLQSMLLARKGMSERDIVTAAVACYGISRTVHTCRISSQGISSPTTTLRLFIRGGMRGGHAKRFIRG